MATWSVIDSAAWTDDETLSSALLQRSAQNGDYINVSHARAGTVGYDNAWRPVMCGAVGVDGAADSWERVCIPYLWDPLDAPTVTVRVSVEMVLPSGTGTFSLDVYWSEASKFERPRGTSLVPGDTTHQSDGASSLSASGDSIESFTLDLSTRAKVATGPIIVWVVGTSTETSVASVETGGVLTKIKTHTLEDSDTGGVILSATAPTRNVSLWENASKQGDFWPLRKQVIRQEDGAVPTSNEDIVYVWPPYVNSVYANAEIATASAPQLSFKTLTSVYIYGVCIENVPAALPSYGSMLNAGVGPGSRAAQYLYSLSAVPWMQRTPVHAIGSISDVSVLDDFATSTPVNMVYPAVKVVAGATWYNLASCYMQHRDLIQEVGASSDTTRIGVHIRALVVLDFSPSDAFPWDSPWFSDDALQQYVDDAASQVTFRVTMTDEDGSTSEVNGDAIEYLMTPMGHNSDPRIQGGTINLCAYLLNLQRGTDNTTTGYRGTNGNLHAHTLNGAMPESAWAQCIGTLIDVEVDDTQTDQRMATLQCKIASPLTLTHVHMLSWLVTSTEYTVESDVAGA